jgi:Pyridoxamine 5''-phosphate oxidase.
MDKNFTENAVKLWKKVGTHNIMVLATGSESRISARPMSIIIYDGKFYCQTDESFLKYRQIAKNPNVALSCNNISIEGKCRIVGHPLDEDNSFFADRFKRHFSNSYKMYTAIPTERLLEITPSLIYLWKYKLLTPYMEYFDFENQIYRIEKMA